MKNIVLFDYPKKLEVIFEKLHKFNIKSIIVGGYIRDFFLKTQSNQVKDIDVELYGISSYEALKDILKEFGEVNTVGKSFGVCKLSLENIEIDFTLPRTDSKISSGHCGFLISIDRSLNFKEASSRRDFTINSIGFNTIDKKLLDPYKGIEDIKNKILRAVDIKKFADDPLRILRLVSFKSRLEFNIDKELFVLCKDMCSKNILFELAKERIFIEIKKVLLKSEKPSSGFLLLKDLGALKYFQGLDTLNEKEFTYINQSLDKFVQIKTKNTKTNLQIMLSILCYHFSHSEIKQFISTLTNDKSIIKNLFLLVKEKFKVTYSDSELYFLANRVNIENFLLLSQALNPSLEYSIFTQLKKRAIALKILNKKALPFLHGRDILTLGVMPSKEYTSILFKAYEAQMNLEINNYDEAKKWLKSYLA